MFLTAEQVVEAFYRAVLNRLPDEEGLYAHSSRLNADPRALMEVASALFHSSEHQQLVRNMPHIMDHSQFGELPIMLRNLLKSGSKHQIIVDVGARGKDRSNSFDLLDRFGWKGLLVEANPALHDQIAQDFDGTDFSLAKCAVGATDGVLPFYIGANDDVSSLLEGAAKSWGNLRGTIEVQVRRLSDVLSEHEIPTDFDILSLDIEGVDVTVLNDLVDHSAYRPRYVIIEASYNFATKALEEVHCSPTVCSAYTIIDQTEANLILQSR